MSLIPLLFTQKMTSVTYAFALCFFTSCYILKIILYPFINNFLVPFYSLYGCTIIYLASLLLIDTLVFVNILLLKNPFKDFSFFPQVTCALSVSNLKSTEMFKEVGGKHSSVQRQPVLMFCHSSCF